jgi:hypothetical protein
LRCLSPRPATVTGVDHDAAMLARRRPLAGLPGEDIPGARQPEPHRGRPPEIDLGARFWAGRARAQLLFLMATYEPVAAVQLARHRRPGGLAVVDVWLPSADELSAYDARARE